MTPVRMPGGIAPLSIPLCLSVVASRTKPVLKLSLFLKQEREYCISVDHVMSTRRIGSRSLLILVFEWNNNQARSAIGSGELFPGLFGRQGEPSAAPQHRLPSARHSHPGRGTVPKISARGPVPSSSMIA